MGDIPDRLIAAADQIDAAMGRDFIDTVGYYYARLVQWGVDPVAAVQMAGFLQQHLQQIRTWEVIHASEKKQPAPPDGSAVEQWVAQLMQGKRPEED